MSEIYKELWESFNDIYFEEDSHKYTDSHNTNYQSVTTLISSLEEEKDWHGIAEKLVNSNNEKYKDKNPDDIVKEWDYNKDYSCVLGTNIHSIMEYGWQNKEFYPNKNDFIGYEGMEDDFNNRKIKAKELLKSLRDTYIPIKNEYIVYDRRWKICGTIDFLAYNKIKNCLSILDWKTNKKWVYSNSYEVMNKPFESLDNCNINHYSLQLNIYKAILEKNTNLKIGEMKLYLIPKDNEVQSYECKDLQSLVIPFLNERIEKTPRIRNPH